MSGRNRSRRRFLELAGTGALLGVAGCSTREDGQMGETTTATSGVTSTTTAAETTTTTEEDATTEETTTETTEETTTTEEGPGYKNDHWHGRLFFEINGERVDFAQPKYYLENLQKDRPETVYFHFHEGATHHGPNEWSNEKKIVTFQRALNLLPGIGYEQQSGEHVVTYDGTTYDARQSGTSISIHRGTESIDPTTYEVQHNDNFWVQVITQDPTRNVSPAHDGADLGTLVFDVNNLRVDFSQPKYLVSNTDNDRFHFHEDGYPGLWYAHETVTLVEALNSLPGIGYSKNGDSHVVTYEDENHASHSREYDGSVSENEIIIRQRATDIDPTSHELQAGDIIWVYVHSSLAPDNEH